MFERDSYIYYFLLFYTRIYLLRTSAPSSVISTIYSIWAEMVAHDARYFPEPESHHFAVYASRRDKYSYKHTHEEIMARYGSYLDYFVQRITLK